MDYSKARIAESIRPGFIYFATDKVLEKELVEVYFE
jgi:hypothetical protein